VITRQKPAILIFLLALSGCASQPIDLNGAYPLKATSLTSQTDVTNTDQNPIDVTNTDRGPVDVATTDKGPISEAGDIRPIPFVPRPLPIEGHDPIMWTFSLISARMADKITGTAIVTGKPGSVMASLSQVAILLANTRTDPDGSRSTPILVSLDGSFTAILMDCAPGDAIAVWTGDPLDLLVDGVLNPNLPNVTIAPASHAGGLPPDEN
jgi:hypothetical protein